MAKRARAAAGAAGTEIGRDTPLGTLWVGRHSGDRDILVLDPEISSSNPQNVSLYSLTQHRLRTFPRSVMAEKIHALEEATELDQAIEAYGSRSSLKEAYDAGLRAVQAEKRTQQREEIIRSHKRYLERIGVKEEGVADTAPDHKNGRRSKCHACGIDLDDFAGLVCAGCDSVLCSCGACACGSASRKRSSAAAQPA